MCKMFSWLALHVVCTCIVQHTCTSPLSSLTQVILIILAFIHEPLNLGCRSRDFFPTSWRKKYTNKNLRNFPEIARAISLPFGCWQKEVQQVKLICLMNYVNKLDFFAACMHFWLNMHNVYIRQCFMTLVTLKCVTVSKPLLNWSSV